MWPLAASAADLPDLDEPLRTGASAPADAAVVVGIADYLFLPDVPFADRDAALVRDWLVSTRGVPPERVRVLTAGAREQILGAVEAAGRDAGPDGTVWLYFAGHGVASPGTGRRLLLGDDTRRAPEAFDARGVELDALSDLAAAGGADVVTWIDTCFNGTGRDGSEMLSETRFAVPDWLSAAREGRLGWAASGPDQFARPLEGARHGAFTWLAVGALRGWADGEVDGVRDGVVTGAEATLFVDRALERLGLQEQDPVLIGDGSRWRLIEGVEERAPKLSEAWTNPPALPPPPPLPAPAPSSLNADLGGRWDPDLVRKADALSVHLPLSKGLLGYRDADGERVKRATYDQLVRATRRGRQGNLLQAAGIVATTVGFGAGMAITAYGLAEEEVAMIGPGVGAAALSISGIVMMASGRGMIEGAVQPH